MLVDMEEVKCWVDGSCHPNPGPGGWGVILRYQQHERELWGGEKFATNNTMELTAAIRALTVLKRPCFVDVYTDSRYVQLGFEMWRYAWRRNDWKTLNGDPIANRDLWIELETAASPHNVAFHWIRGHVGHFNNERADRLARRGRDQLRPYGM